MMATQNDAHPPMSDDPYTIHSSRVGVKNFLILSFSLSPFLQRHLAREGNKNVVAMLPINPPGLHMRLSNHTLQVVPTLAAVTSTRDNDEKANESTIEDAQSDSRQRGAKSWHYQY